MKKIISISLRKTHKAIRTTINQTLIVDTAWEIVHDDMTFNQLINKVSVILLSREEVNVINDMTLEFRRNLLEYIQETIDNIFEVEYRLVKWFDKDGYFCSAEYPHIINTVDKPEINKSLFREVSEPVTTVTLKGSNKVMDNNSKDILELYASTNMMVRDDIDPDTIRLYSALEYERNKGNVSEPMMKYRQRMINLAEETILYMGYVFADTRKFDSSSRDYSLNRFGHAQQYSDSFQKSLIQPELTYTVTKDSIKIAKEYLLDEFKVDRWYPLYKRSIKLVDENLELLKDWNDGLKVNFTIDGKELGKALHVMDVVNNIIRNEGNKTRTLTPFDLTNSGGIMFSSQFGDEKWCTATNLIGTAKQDSHQLVADEANTTRDKAKKISQGPNHGARLTEVTEPIMIGVFGEKYRVINRFAEYGKKLLFNGVTHVEFTAPDGVKSFFNGYTNSAEMDINGTKVGLIAPFTKHDIGERKGYGFAKL